MKSAVACTQNIYRPSLAPDIVWKLPALKLRYSYFARPSSSQNELYRRIDQIFMYISLLIYMLNSHTSRPQKSSPWSQSKKWYSETRITAVS